MLAKNWGKNNDASILNDNFIRIISGKVIIILNMLV